VDSTHLAGSVNDACVTLQCILRHGKHLKPPKLPACTAGAALLEIALAQGFKSAANRRLKIRMGASVYLVRQAEEMLKYSRYWFTQLTLIHALCLWALPDERDTSIPGRAPGKSGSADGQEPAKTGTARRSQRGTGPAATVARWLTMAGSRCAPADQHAAGSQARTSYTVRCGGGRSGCPGLGVREPVRFIWIDESGIVRKVGSRPPARDYRKHNL
jgi:hypothetical protein